MYVGLRSQAGRSVVNCLHYQKLKTTLDIPFLFPILLSFLYLLLHIHVAFICSYPISLTSHSNSSYNFIFSLPSPLSLSLSLILISSPLSLISFFLLLIYSVSLSLNSPSLLGERYSNDVKDEVQNVPKILIFITMPVCIYESMFFFFYLE